MAARIDPATFDWLATESTRARLAMLTLADLDLPSPCDGWAVRSVLSHLVGGNIRFAQALRGETADWPSRDLEPVTAPLLEFDRTAALMADALAGLDDPSKPVVMQVGEPPAAFAAGVHSADMLVHGWDIAVATGQDRTLDPDLCAAAMKIVQRYPPTFWGTGQFFADQLATTSADPQQQLLALTGRAEPA